MAGRQLIASTASTAHAAGYCSTRSPSSARCRRCCTTSHPVEVSGRVNMRS